MRYKYLATGPVLAGCAFVALTSCSTDDKEPSPGLGPSISASAAAASAYDIVKVPSMTIDGNLNDWANIAAISMADNSGRGAGLDNTAKVKLAWNDTYLYAAYDVTDSELLATQTVRDNPDIYKDDAVELYIDPQGDGSSATSMTATDYQFLSNVKEALGDLRGNGTGGKDASFNASSFMAKAVTNGTLNASGADVGYTVELRISWSDLGVTPAAGNFMRIDPAVDDDDTGNTQTQEFDWAGLTQFNNPSGWKDVQLVNRPPPTSAYDIVQVPAAMTIDGSLADWAGIAAISMADTATGWAGKNTAKVKLAWDPTYLYMAYDVTDTDLEAVETARDAANIYQDDEVELYIDPQGDGWTAPTMTPTDYQFLANVRDALGDKMGTVSGGKDASFNAPSFLAKAVTNGTLNASGTDVGYTVEARIAWADLGVTPAAGNFLRIDPAVGDRDGNPPPHTESFDWAGLTIFNNPIAWKDVKLAVDNTAPATATNLVLTVVSSSQIDLSWTASTSTDVAKYNIYRSTTGTPTLYKTVTGSPYHDTGLTSGTYTYQISAVDAAGNESAKTATKSATTTPSGFPFGVGPWHAPTQMVGATAKWSGAQENGYAPNLRRMLDSLQASNSRVVLSVLRSAMKDANGSLSFSMFTSEMNAWKNAVPNLGTYFTGGTVIAINIMDDASSAWTPAVTPSDIDSLAHIVKNLFPGAVTSARQAPAEKDGSSYFGTTTMRWLDLAWAQYDGPYRDEAPATYRDKQVAGAKAHGLGLILALNVLDGGCGSPTPACLPGIPGTNILGTFQNAASVRRYQMSAAEVTEYGRIFIQEPYNCVLLGWQYSPIYTQPGWMSDSQYNGIVNFDNRSDVISAWQQLVSQGKSRGPGHCTRAP